MRRITPTPRAKKVLSELKACGIAHEWSRPGVRIRGLFYTVARAEEYVKFARISDQNTGAKEPGK